MQCNPFITHLIITQIWVVQNVKKVYIEQFRMMSIFDLTFAGGLTDLMSLTEL